MNIFVYSDESGVFDKSHNELFVFGGVVFFSKEEKDICARKYLHAERAVRSSENIPKEKEVKATTISNENKAKLFRSLGDAQKFAVIIKQKQILDQIFQGKKDKQRYLDYAYKIGIKRCFQQSISSGKLNPDDVTDLFFFVDEHTTATNGYYELRESLEQEFRFGTYNVQYSQFYPPIFPNLKNVSLKFCNSASMTLVRASDIVANKVFYLARNHLPTIDSVRNLYYSYLP